MFKLIHKKRATMLFPGDCSAARYPTWQRLQINSTNLRPVTHCRNIHNSFPATATEPQQEILNCQSTKSQCSRDRDWEQHTASCTSLGLNFWWKWPCAVTLLSQHPSFLSQSPASHRRCRTGCLGQEKFDFFHQKLPPTQDNLSSTTQNDNSSLVGRPIFLFRFL